MAWNFDLNMCILLHIDFSRQRYRFCRKSIGHQNSYLTYLCFELKCCTLPFPKTKNYQTRLSQNIINVIFYITQDQDQLTVIEEEAESSRELLYKEYITQRGEDKNYILFYYFFFFHRLLTVKMRVVPFLSTALLWILSMNPEVTSQSNCYIKTNGCSVPLDLPFIYKNTFRPACVKHDVCYSCVRYGISLLICVIFIHTYIIVPFW